MPKRAGRTKEKWAIICPRCESRVIYYRNKTRDFVCRRCGAIFKPEITKR
uniref:Putative transcription factor TFIIB zinc-binding motif n=1 Tax=viral metagenome TaxID=1070528 RepID=A0A6H1ZNR1_9ZZZZ